MRSKQRVRVQQYAMTTKQVKQSVRIALLADLHNKEYGHENKQLIEMVREQSPDVIVIAGDLMIAKGCRSIEQLQIAMTLVEALCRIAPVYYGNGNHERTLKESEEIPHLYAYYRQWLLNAQVVHLENESVYLEKYGVTIRGLDLPRKYFKRIWKTSLEISVMNDLIGTACKDSFELLIAHNPEYFEEYIIWGANLILSGHIHGGIIRVPYLGGLLSPALHFFPKYDGGEFQSENNRMIISRGLGMHTIPIRMNNPPELVMIHIEKE
ncbi:MAG: metallophosphoesterase [Eubacteriales bacterium]